MSELEVLRILTPGPCSRLLVTCLCRSDFTGVEVWDAAVSELLMEHRPAEVMPAAGHFSLPAGEEPDRIRRDNLHTEGSARRLWLLSA